MQRTKILENLYQTKRLIFTKLPDIILTILLKATFWR